MAKCPKCDRDLAHLDIKQVPAATAEAKFRAIIFTCPSCGVAIGSQIDPILLADHLTKRSKQT